MTFADEVAIGLGQGRGLALERMDSLCRYKYPTGATALVHGREEPVYAVRAAEVPCRVHPPDAAGEETEPAGGMGAKIRRTWSIPTDAVAPKVGDLLELTTAGPMTDAALAGKEFKVLDAGDASQATARRMRVEGDA